MNIFDIWFLVKVAFLFALLLYIVFSVVVVRQVYLMTSTIQTGFEFPVRSLAWIHLFVAISVLILAFIVL